MKRNSQIESLGVDYIARSIAEKAGISIEKAKAAYKVIPEVFTEAMINDVPINLPGFCVFYPKIHNRKAIYSPNRFINKHGLPQCSKKSEGGIFLALELPPTKSIYMKVSNVLKLKLNPEKFEVAENGRIRVKPEIFQKAVNEKINEQRMHENGQ